MYSQFNNTKIAYYKILPSKSLPSRPGPIQYFRSCPNCVSKDLNDKQIYSKVGPLEIKTFDNLLLRSKVHSSNYRCLQYHIGQLDILKQSRLANPNKVYVYVIFANRLHDWRYFKQVMAEGVSDVEYALPSPQLISSIGDFYKAYNNDIAFVMKHKTCLARCGDFFFNIQMMKHLFELLSKNFPNSCVITPVCITKDHDLDFKKLGSVSIQILEPLNIESYFDHISKSNTVAHLALHVNHDAVRASLVLPANLVAFIILYLRDKGVNHKELVQYLDWFRIKTLDFNMHLGFTGESEDVADFGLFILKDFITKEKNSIYHVRDEKSLEDYATMIVPFIAYHGIIAMAILIEHNKINTGHYLEQFEPEVHVKVAKDKTFETASKLTSRNNLSIYCSPPCVTTSAKIEDVFSQMCSVEHYFRLEEPRSRMVQKVCMWAGDFEIDDDFNERRRKDVNFQSTIIVTRRPHRLDRLNLFINAIVAIT